MLVHYAIETCLKSALIRCILSDLDQDIDRYFGFLVNCHLEA